MTEISPKEKAEMIESYARDNLIGFCIANNPAYQANWHHDVIADKLQDVESGKVKRLMIFTPPRHGKSELSTINFPVWYLGKNNDKEVVTASYSEILATDFGKKARDTVSDPVYKAIFGMSLKADEKSKLKWRTTKGGTYTSVGIGGALTGRGANLLIIDDPIKSSEEAESKVYRDKVWDWYRTVAYTRLMKGAAVVLILTRWHKDDLAGRLIEAENDGGEKWEKIILPAIATADEEHRKAGEALWEDQFPLKRLEEIKGTLGIYNWSSLYQQDPITSENQVFSGDWFKYRDQGDVDALDTRNFLVVDAAVSTKDGADYTGFCDNKVDSENKWNLCAWRERISPKDLVNKLFDLHKKNNYERIGIEKMMATMAIKPFLNDEMRKRNVFLPIVELKPHGKNKEVRIKWLEPRYSSGSIYHIRGRCTDLEEELLTFPKGIHDDTMDATAYMEEIAEPYVKIQNTEPEVYTHQPLNFD